MRSFLRNLWPRTQVHLLLGRPGGREIPPFSVEGVTTIVVRSPGDAAAAELEAFAERQGFPEAWAHEMLAGGASGTVVRDAAAGAILAMGWATAQPFHVEEIAATLEPRDGGVYLFGDFVSPAARGRKLQRLMVAERLRTHDVRYACTLVHPSNGASLTSYQHEGFGDGGRFRRWTWRGRSWARCRTFGGTPIRFALQGGDRLIVGYAASGSARLGSA
jgi:ribosomal protein S18 acetylase RimI-like enzyme